MAFLAAPAAAGPRFEARDLPLEHQYLGGWEHYVGGGVAAFDCDGDFFPDLYAAGGEAPAQLLRNTTKASGGSIQFEAITPRELAVTGVIGAYPFDFDGDAILDLYLLRVGANRLMKGKGECRFADVTEDVGLVAADRWSTAFSATWEAGASLPTLAVGNYVDRTDPEGPFEACDVNELHRPDGDRYGAPVILEPGWCPLSMLFSDWGRRGRQDLRISNDRHYFVRGGGEEMWRLDAEPRRYGEAEGWRAFPIWGMGIASRDVTGDGEPDVYLTSMGDQILQFRETGAAGPVWRDAPFAQGATAHMPYTGDDGRPSTGWHAEWGDVDNDGRDDLFVAKGNVEQMPDSATHDPNNLLMQRADGTFREAGLEAGLASPVRGRGASVVDLNRDGLLDIVVVNRRAPMEVHENVTTGAGHWVAFDVRQEGPNSRMVGGFIEVQAGERTWTREITVGGGHAGGQAGPHYFGLGNAEEAEVRLVAPDGMAGPWRQVAAGRAYRALWRDGDTRIEPLPE